MTTILCIEDEPLLREEIVGELKDEGYEVLEAGDGREGLEMMLAHEPNLVICDINMPRMNGYDLVTTLRKQHLHLADTPFIYLSALADRGDILEGMSLGADDYLTKPVDFDLLLGKIETNLRQVDRMRARKEQQLTYMAHHDALTGLPNRVLLGARIEQALELAENGQGFAILFLDLDGFKSVNDTLGHLIGDELLKAVAERLRHCVRKDDTIARMGGDEFAIVQPSNQQPEDATALARRISEVLKTPFNLKDHQFVVGASIGITVAPGDGTNPTQLLKNADLALYRAKNDGRGTFRFFEPEMDEHLKARCQLELDLRKALQLEEFELYYQPLVNIKTGQITGFEALLRWNHPECGVVSPGDFISVAEEIGLIIPLGEWVIRTACMEAADWPTNLKVAVNLSPMQFRSDNLVQAVFCAIANSGIRPNRLELEITESVLLLENSSALETLHKLRDFGVRIAMDDFGTGYSSLSLLRSFPFDKIKIDKSFVTSLSEGNSEIAIVRAIADLASAFGMETTAEGVETEEQWELVQAEGCTEAQGFFFSSPKSAEEIDHPCLPEFKTKADGAA